MELWDKWKCSCDNCRRKGYFEDEGIQIDPVEANANADAMTLLATGKVDVVSNAGTSNPLQQIASGVDISVFGGHMIEGCMPDCSQKKERNGREQNRS